jgi:hypothetical protein
MAMDELNLFRDFRSGAAPPSEEARRRASARLTGAIDDEQSLERGLDGRPARAGLLRWALKRPAYVAFASVALVGAAAAALFASAPWNASPGFLERAQAALAAAPTTGTVLHMKWDMTFTSTTLGCTVERGPNEVWIDQNPPHRYRVLVKWIPDPTDTDRAIACPPDRPAELGGSFDQRETLRFVPPNSLSFLPNQNQFVLPPDPVTQLREAISAGTAHDEGKTQLDGRTVELIRRDPPTPSECPSCPQEPQYDYVDPETYYPVKVDGPGSTGVPGLKLRVVMRILAFDYLPRTDANLALTNIRAQHPNATGP